MSILVELMLTVCKKMYIFKQNFSVITRLHDKHFPSWIWHVFPLTVYNYYILPTFCAIVPHPTCITCTQSICLLTRARFTVRKTNQWTIYAVISFFASWNIKLKLSTTWSNNFMQPMIFFLKLQIKMTVLFPFLLLLLLLRNV